MWEKSININSVCEILGKTKVYLGVGAINKVNDIATDLTKRGIKKAIIITGKTSYVKTGVNNYLETALKDNNIEFIIYNKVTPNPTVEQVDEAVKMGKEFGADCVIGVGGGSPIDTAKSTAILLENKDYNCTELYEGKFSPEKAKPIIAINLTHGTGTEANRFAVVTITEKEYKPAIAFDCIYPLYSIDDPNLMTSLSKEQTIYVSLDAVNHVVEAATTKLATPYSITLAKEVIEIVAKYLPKAVENSNDLEARYFLCYAACIAGISFDNGLLHFTHALEHPLSGVKPDLAHGLGLAMLLPSVLEEIYVSKMEVLKDLFSPIINNIESYNENDGHKIFNEVRNWIKSFDIKSKLSDIGITLNDIDKFVDLCFETPSLAGLLQVAPVNADKEVVRRIYETSL